MLPVPTMCQLCPPHHLQFYFHLVARLRLFVCQHLAAFNSYHICICSCISGCLYCERVCVCVVLFVCRCADAFTSACTSERAHQLGRICVSPSVWAGPPSPASGAALKRLSNEANGGQPAKQPRCSFCKPRAKWREPHSHYSGLVNCNCCFSAQERRNNKRWRDKTKIKRDQRKEILHL